MGLVQFCWDRVARQQWPSASGWFGRRAAPQVLCGRKMRPHPLHPHFLAWSSPAVASTGCGALRGIEGRREHCQLGLTDILWVLYREDDATARTRKGTALQTYSSRNRLGASVSGMMLLCHHIVTGNCMLCLLTCSSRITYLYSIFVFAGSST